MTGEKTGEKSISTSRKMKRKGQLHSPSFGTVYVQSSDGLRRVQPYRHEHQVFAKQRWLGRSLINVLSSEFSSKSDTYFHQAISSSLITVNGTSVDPSYEIKDSDRINHIMHRHEPPVQGGPIKIIAVTEDMVVVDKPASLHVHPCGSFTHNSVQQVLAAEAPGGIGVATDGGMLRAVHRLDRLVSGVLVFARSSAAAKRLTDEIQSGDVEKCYVARVRGNFPVSAQEVISELPHSISSMGSVSDCDSGGILLSVPLRLSKSRHDGAHECCSVSEGGKEACTHFKVLRSANGQSLVQCRPLTGRTHQVTANAVLFVA